MNRRAIGECPGLILDNEPLDEVIRVRLEALTRVRLIELRLYDEVVKDWNSGAYRGREDPKGLISYMIQRALEHYEILREKGLWIK